MLQKKDENARSDEICESYERISSIVYAFFQSHSRVRARIQESVLYGLTSIDKDRCCQLFFLVRGEFIHDKICQRQQSNRNGFNGRRLLDRGAINMF